MTEKEAQQFFLKIENEILFGDMPRLHESRMDANTANIIANLNNLDFDITLRVIHKYFCDIALAIGQDVIQVEHNGEIFVDKHLYDTTKQLEGVINSLKPLMRDVTSPESFSRDRQLHLENEREVNNCLSL
jgi:hypothetical protein